MVEMKDQFINDIMDAMQRPQELYPESIVFWATLAPTTAFCPTIAFGKATTKITVLSLLSLSLLFSEINSLIREPLKVS